MKKYVWAASYLVHHDCFAYRRFENEVPERAKGYERDPPPRVVAFCDAENTDVCIDDELTGGPRHPIKSDNRP